VNPRLVFIAAVILAYTGVFFIFKKKYLSLLGGIEYLFIGFLLSLFTIETASLQPLLYPFLGWIGLLMGLQLKLSYLKGLPKDFYLKVVLYALGTALGTAALLWLLDFHWNTAAAALALSSVCYKTTAHFIPARVKSNRFALFFISFIPFVLVLLLFTFYLISSGLASFLLTAAVAIVFSIIVRMVLAVVEERGSVILLLIGFIIFISETCALLKISPMVVTFFIGIYITNFSHWKEFIFSMVYRDEKPLYTLFLILLGLVAGIAPDTGMVLEILFIVAAVTLVKCAVFHIKPMGFQRYPWYLFLAPGGFSLAVLTDWWLKSGAPRETGGFSSLLIGVILLQFISILLGKRKKYGDG
jgi:hypothetical protein